MAIVYAKADEISKSPCSICAEKMGENVYCRVGNLERIYYPNFTIVDTGVK